MLVASANMSRSYHITKGEAAKRLATEGDIGGVLNFAEKKTLKKVVRKFRSIYATIHPSDKPSNKLRGSVAQRATKILTEGDLEKAEKAIARKGGRHG